MDLEREAIERRDFSTARRGYEPSEVDAHLRALARAVEDLRERSTQASSLSGAASERLRVILDAAEASAAEIRSDAEEEGRRVTAEAEREARETVEEAERRASDREAKSETFATEGRTRVEERTAALLHRAGELDTELDSVLESIRAAGTAAIEALRGEAGRLGAAAEDLPSSSEPAARGAGDSSTAGEDTLIVEPAGDSGLLGDEVIPEPEGEEALPEPPEPPLVQEPGAASAPAGSLADEASVTPMDEPLEEPALEEVGEPPEPVSSEPTGEEPQLEPVEGPLAGADEAAPPAEAPDGSSTSPAAPRGPRGGQRSRSSQRGAGAGRSGARGGSSSERSEAPSTDRASAPASRGASRAGSSAQRAGSSTDVEGARLIALNMALSGSSREETGQYLRETFGLEDDALLDDVYERVNPS